MHLLNVELDATNYGGTKHFIQHVRTICLQIEVNDRYAICHRLKREVPKNAKIELFRLIYFLFGFPNVIANTCCNGNREKFYHNEAVFATLPT